MTRPREHLARLTLPTHSSRAIVDAAVPDPARAGRGPARSRIELVCFPLRGQEYGAGIGLLKETVAAGDPATDSTAGQGSVEIARFLGDELTELGVRQRGVPRPRAATTTTIAAHWPRTPIGLNCQWFRSVMKLCYQ